MKLGAVNEMQIALVNILEVFQHLVPLPSFSHHGQRGLATGALGKGGKDSHTLDDHHPRAQLGRSFQSDCNFFEVDFV